MQTLIFDELACAISMIYDSAIGTGLVSEVFLKTQGNSHSIGITAHYREEVDG